MLVPTSAREPNPKHFAMFEEAMDGVHSGMSPETLQSFYQVQVVWDSVMADSIVRALESRPQIAHMVVIAGVFHVRDRLGIPFRVSLSNKEPSVVVIPIEIDIEDPPTAEEIFGSGVGEFVWGSHGARDSEIFSLFGFKNLLKFRKIYFSILISNYFLNHFIYLRVFVFYIISF